jgi:hypothetical protein
VVAADQENAAIGEPFERVPGDDDAGGLHARVIVAEDDAVVRSRVGAGRLPVDAGVVDHAAVVEAVEVDALAVDIDEPVAGVVGTVDVAGRVDGDCDAVAFHVDDPDGKPEFGTVVVLDADARGVADLDRVSAHGGDGVVVDPAIGLAGRPGVGMGPDGVSGDALDDAADDLERGNAFFK